ncbi:MAG: metalloregulator ArsR/SmtB family transcription factor [Pseudomonadota bacterium]
MKEPDALTLLGSLANPARLSAIRALVRAGPEGLPAGTVAKAMSASPSQASFHLANLANAGLVTSERHAREIRYRIAYERIGALIDYLFHDCCAGDPALSACCTLPLKRKR